MLATANRLQALGFDELVDAIHRKNLSRSSGLAASDGNDGGNPRL